MRVWVCVCACLCALRGDAALLGGDAASLKAVLAKVAEKVEDAQGDLAQAIEETVGLVVCALGGGGVRRCSGLPAPRLPPLPPLESLLPLPRAAPAPPASGADLAPRPLTLHTLVSALFDAADRASDHGTAEEETASNATDNSTSSGNKLDKDMAVDGTDKDASGPKDAKDTLDKKAEDQEDKSANSTKNAEVHPAPAKEDKTDVVDSAEHAADKTTVVENVNSDETGTVKEASVENSVV